MDGLGESENKEDAEENIKQYAIVHQINPLFSDSEIEVQNEEDIIEEIIIQETLHSSEDGRSPIPSPLDVKPRRVQKPLHDDKRIKTSTFLKCYRKYSCLWDPENPDFNEHEKKNAAWNSLIADVGVPNLTKCDVLKKLKNVQTTYARNLKKSMTTPKNVKWQHFETAHDVLHKTSLLARQYECVNKKKRHREEDDSSDDSDESSSFHKFLKVKLRKLEQRKRHLARMEIMDVLYKVEYSDSYS